MEKVKLFTHGSDLDGISCAILGVLAFGEENIDIEYCDYDDVNQKVEEFYIGSEKNHYEKVFITDISVNEEVAKIIEYYKDGRYYPSTMLLDHHKSALWLNGYDWANVVIEDEIEKVSGTSLFYKYLYEYNYLLKTDELDYFIEKVKRYDTWLWKEKYNDMEARDLNDLFFIYGKDRFINKILNSTTGQLVTDTDKLLLELNEEKKQKYIESRNEEMMIYSMSINSMINNIGVVFAEQYISELGNNLATLHPELDFIAIVNKCGTVSLRGVKDDVDLSKIAECYGGGGHPKASGFEIKEDIKKRILHEIFLTGLKIDRKEV